MAGAHSEAWGNAGRNVMRRPGQRNFDVAIYKERWETPD